MHAMTDIPAPLVFTDNAANKVKQLIEEEGNNELKLRVFVTGGGCSGFQYGFTFEESVNEDDTPMEKNGVTLLIDPMSLQYPDGMNFRGAIYWAGNGLNGPVAPPGAYRIRMTVAADAPQVQPFRLQKDPRTTASEADLVEQFNFLMRIRDTVSAANKAVRTVRNARYQVDSIKKGIPGQHKADFDREADAMVDSTRRTEEELYQTKNEAGEDPLNFPVRLNNQVGALSGFVGSAPRRPPPQAYEVWNTLAPQLNTQLKRLDTQWKLMLPKVNAVLKAAGMAPIVLSSDELGTPRPAFVP